MPVACQHHAEPAGVEMESVRVRQARQRMPCDHQVVLEALQLVGRVDPHGGQSSVVERRAQVVLLVPMAHGDGHALGHELDGPVAGPLVTDGGPSLYQAAGEPRDHVHGQRIRGQHGRLGQPDVRPPGGRRLVQRAPGPRRRSERSVCRYP